MLLISHAVHSLLLISKYYLVKQCLQNCFTDRGIYLEETMDIILTIL